MTSPQSIVPSAVVCLCLLFLTILAFLVGVAVLRWMLRVNPMIKLLEEIRDILADLRTR